MTFQTGDETIWQTSRVLLIFVRSERRLTVDRRGRRCGGISRYRGCRFEVHGRGLWDKKIRISSVTHNRHNIQYCDTAVPMYVDPWWIGNFLSPCVRGANKIRNHHRFGSCKIYDIQQTVRIIMCAICYMSTPGRRIKLSYAYQGRCANGEPQVGVLFPAHKTVTPFTACTYSMKVS